MKILSVHNKYQIRGGEDYCHEEECALLRLHGHILDSYEENNNKLVDFTPFKSAQKTIWSQETFNSISNILTTHRYDLVHVHNFFPLVSPSVYYAAYNNGVPIIQTLHNYRLLCPNGLFFRQGKVCEACLGKTLPWPSVLHGCYKEDRLASAAVASMLFTHSLLSTWIDKVDAYIALTEFARQKFISGGLPPEKIFVKPNFVYNDLGSGLGSGNYAIYVGRLSVEKGLDILLDAWTRLSVKLPLKIIGDGPLANVVSQASESNSSIEWLGRKPIQEVYELIGEAKFLIFPSKWYETFGRVAIEAFSKGTPVIASRFGAMAELIDHRRTGLHFTPGDAVDLATQVDWAMSHESELAAMRHAARSEFEQHYTAAANYARLMEIYESAIQAKGTAIPSVPIAQSIGASE
ncbi:MAG: glycosyltransferase family 4 protein [Spirulina sp.]